MKEEVELSTSASLWRRTGNSLLAIEIFPILVSMAVLFLFFGLWERQFFTVVNLINVLRNASYLMIIAAGQMLVLVVGGFDLSVGGVAALASTTSSLVMVHLIRGMPDHGGLATVIGMVVGLLGGVAVGTVNGLCVSVLGVSPFIVTLGTLSICHGVAFHLTGGMSIDGIPEVFLHIFGRGRWLGLNFSIYLMTVVVVVLWVIMNWTRLGRHIYAIGGNIHAARVSGIPTIQCTIVAYALCGFLASLTGLLVTARVGYGEAALGEELMLQSIAAAILGGVSLRGGIGRVEFVVIGTLFLGLVTNGMNLIRVNSKLQTIVIGIIMIIAVAVDLLKRRDVSE